MLKMFYECKPTISEHSQRKLLSKSILRKIFFCLVSLTAFYHALINVLVRGRVNSDHADTLMLWYGFKQYGWKFIKTWLYTQDNWLLSLLPFHALMYSIFPFSPLLIVLAGFLVFLLNIIFCGMIAKLLRAKNSVYLVPIFLMCSGDFFYTYSNALEPICHNITHFFGLLSLFLAMRWVKAHRPWSLAMLCFSMVAGGVSDPWFMPTFALPLLLTAFAIKKQEPYLFRGVLAAFFLIITHVLGLFSFLEGMSYHIANRNQFISNIGRIVNNLGLFINFFPIQAHWAGMTSLVILLILTGLIIHKIKQQKFSLENTHKIFFLSIGFSFIILTLSFLFHAGNSLYYLFNLFILTILIISVGIEHYWQTFSPRTQAILLFLSVLYIASGLSTTVPIWKQAPQLPPNEYDSLMALLTKNGWTYGYADYWQANALTALSHDSIRVRPIAFFDENGYMYRDKRRQTSPLWYLPADIPANQKYFFVYLTPGQSRTNELFYQKAMTAQFGVPVATQTYQQGIIMVWDHPLKIIHKKDFHPWDTQIPLFILLMLI